MRVALVLFGGIDRWAIDRGDNALAAGLVLGSHIPAVRTGTLLVGWHWTVLPQGNTKVGV